MKTIKILGIFTALILLSSCEEYLDINHDPRFPTTATAEVLMPPLFWEMTRGEVFDSRYFGMYTQNWHRTSPRYWGDLHGYLPGSDAAGEKWRQHYWAIGTNIDLITDDAEASKKWWYVGAAKAIRAWSWQSSTDVYGEMIFKQAWEPGRYIFDYDNQAEIYDEVVRLCNESLDYLNKNDETNTLIIGDLVYGGDADKWKKFVYATLARNAHHISNKSSYDPNKVIEYVDKSFASNEDNFNVPFAATSSADANFYGSKRGNLGVYRQSEFAISLVDGTVFSGVVDPRLAEMFQASPDGIFRGLTAAVGDTSSGDQDIPPFYGKYVYQDDVVHPLITFWELQFMKAEAALIKGDKPLALTAYNNGIEAHMDFVGINQVDKDAYMASAAVAQTPDVLALSDIMLQKYISLHAIGILETWVDLRRYDYDPAVYTGFTLPDPLYGDNGGKPVYRARPRYNSEYKWNVDALEKIGGTSVDFHTTKPWYLQP
ncbi:MAG: SusD/RagB family nutrient-binding outer membrane lipoprotein [Cyclobacteriaceae bacterium]|nr:SusD/RagB family nutrient-binding outer membrane lipoprotein [Cyclobacteriaceae bacterium]